METKEKDLVTENPIRQARETVRVRAFAVARLGMGLVILCVGLYCLFAPAEKNFLEPPGHLIFGIGSLLYGSFRIWREVVLLKETRKN